MSDWIVDRRPTKADADKNNQVLAWVLDNGYKDYPRWVFRHYTNVEVGQPWLPTPEPYVPPIDTSLAASIERVTLDDISSLSDDGTGQYTVTFTNNFNYTRHASVASCGDDTSSYDSVVSLDPFPSASEQWVLCWDLIDHVLEDQLVVSIISHGDLA